MAMRNSLPSDLTCSPKIHALERSSKLSYAEFATRYLYPNRPVVLTDAASGWRALSRWNLDFFSREFSDRKVVLRRGKKKFKSTMKDFIEYAKTFAEAYGGRTAETRPYYLCNASVGALFPELLRDFTVPEFFQPNWLERWPLTKLLPLAPSSSAELFVGPQGASLPMIHRDRLMTHSWLSQVSGHKAFWAVSPEENACMYQDPANPDHSLVNSMPEPDLRKFPLFAQAKVFGTVLHSGDTVFIPAGWWHAAECLDLSISLSGNFVNQSNFAQFCDMASLPAFHGQGKLRRALNRVFLHAHGSACRMRDGIFSSSPASRK